MLQANVAVSTPPVNLCMLTGTFEETGTKACMPQAHKRPGNFFALSFSVSRKGSRCTILGGGLEKSMENTFWIFILHNAVNVIKQGRLGTSLDSKELSPCTNRWACVSNEIAKVRVSTSRSVLQL